ncbi:MAG TPA: hypothetical protein VE690_23640 [Rhodopila sp.]|nr:hypothetical protein [Rhodopila sp.]
MNPVRLARIAAEAETLRLRAMAGRYVQRIVFAIVALLFMLAVLVFVHVIAWYALNASANLGFYNACLIVGGVDLLIALLFLALAARSAPSSAEREAVAVRQRAIEGMQQFGTYSQLALPALRLAASMRRRRRHD